MGIILLLERRRDTRRPDTQTIELPKDVCYLARLLNDIGHRFEYELSPDDTLVSITVFDNAENKDVDLEVTPSNAPGEIRTATERLIRRYAQKTGVV